MLSVKWMFCDGMVSVLWMYVLWVYGESMGKWESGRFWGLYMFDDGFK